ncbi:TetR/AcrR family transcriptional regulator [Jidongwangia harbinensis]|uniref:TetR/AcrR family transcriptional regulator n=1 Tax=Jidongwangia harbinensis TaxID=2878561 RepID=UPI001CDA1195|nr:TetR/AcrR family transcriptional regulator [Jidongwangia harbinensis]MCA2213830.1 TetR/AcrR family transcriptional regulator [Jidongwangia harbinensis]
MGSSIWNRPERGTRGPAPGHSRDAIVAAAVVLADAEGLAAVSMRAVAGALGTGAGSLYRYLSSRDDLLDLMTDAAMAEMRPYPDGDRPWPDAMLTVARRQLELYRRHRWLIDAATRPAAPGPNVLEYFDHCLRLLAPVDCPDAAKFEAIAMVTGVVTLFARSEGAYPLDGVDPVAHPHLAAALSRPSSAPRTDLFDRSVRSLLSGLLAPG